MRQYLISIKSKIVVTLFSIFIIEAAHSQKTDSNLVYDYMTMFERWKLINNVEDSFILTTNNLFSADTTINIKGRFVKQGDIIQFIADTANLDKYFLRRNISNEQLIAHNSKFPYHKEAIIFINVLRRIYDTSRFDTTISGTYYRGDGYWTNLITINRDSTYRISESVHGNIDYTETGKWQYKKGVAILIPDKAAQSWIDRYTSNNEFLVNEDFLIGIKYSRHSKGKTFYYFNKWPIED